MLDLWVTRSDANLLFVLLHHVCRQETKPIGYYQRGSGGQNAWEIHRSEEVS